MPLTPADVHNVVFKKPPIGKRGYDEDEVDAFLDVVEAELARLIEENNELRSGAVRGGAGMEEGPAPPPLTEENTELRWGAVRGGARMEEAPAPAPAAAPVAAPPPPVQQPRE